MNNETHDPREFARQLQQILVSNSKRIGFLLGAGTSMLKEKIVAGQDEKQSLVPGTKAMTESVIKAITDEKFVEAIQQIKKELELSDKPFQIENLISSIDQKEMVVALETLCGLNRDNFIELKKQIKEHIKELASIHKEVDILKWDLTHYKFARWINDTTRKSAIELFTTNYDYLLEISFEKFGYPYFDGFIGGYKPFFHAASVEDDNLLPHWTKLWKLHGSLGWALDDTHLNEKKIYRADGDIVIYPSILKYDNSRKQPYVSFMDRLYRFLKTDDSVLLICGYSFGDDHINEILLNGLSKTRNSSVITFLYDNGTPFTEASKIFQLAKSEYKLSAYGKRSAVIGGKHGKWKLRNQPSDEDDIEVSKYFDQDAPKIVKDQGQDDEVDTREGDFKLVDFAQFVTFLAESAYMKHKVK